MHICIFESGFSGLEDRSDSDNTVYNAYYNTDNGNDPLERFKTLLADRTAGETAAEILTVNDVKEEDWEATWREGLGVIEVGSRLAIRPSWITYENPDERVEIVIDPKMAFGTGGHESTRLCLDILETKTLKDVSVLDAGCGSGVLSIAAVKLGARCAIGFDHDSDSITNADENTRANRVHDYITVYPADLSDVMPGHFNLIFANMISSSLIPNIHRFHEFLTPGGRIVFSGLLATEEEAFIALLKKEGYAIIQVRRLGEWIAVEVEEAV